MQAVLGSLGDCQGPDEGEWPHTTGIPLRQRCLDGATSLAVSQRRGFRGFPLCTWLDTQGNGV